MSETRHLLLALAQLVAHVTAKESGRAEVLETLEVGIVFRNAQGDVVRANAEGLRWLASGGTERRFSSLTDKHPDVAGSGQNIIEGNAARPPSSAEAYWIAAELPMNAQRCDGASSITVMLASGHIDDEHGKKASLTRELEGERARFAMIFEKAPSFMAVLRGQDNTYELANPAYLAMVGRVDIVGQQLLHVFPEVRHQGYVELLAEVRRTGQPFSAREMRLDLHRQGDDGIETRYRDIVYQRLEEPNATQVAVVAHGIDVTSQVIARKALEESEERIHTLFATMPVATFVWTISETVTCTDVNHAGQALLPLSALRCSPEELLPSITTLRSAIIQSMAESKTVYLNAECKNTDGRQRTYEITLGPQPPAQVLMHVVDTSERSYLETQLRQAQKMEAIGLLAGGVAHDFNNLLTVIVAHTTFLLETLESSDSRREDGQAILQAAARAADLTRQLLAFGRKQLLRPVVADLNMIIREVDRLLARVLTDDIVVTTALETNCWQTMVDVGQIHQVLMNLTVNARDAMPMGGTLQIATRNITVSSQSPHAASFVLPGEYVQLSVSDSGSGMDAGVRARIFEPFYTTKEFGKGAGLGLATVYGIIKQSGAYIDVVSTPGSGTTFHLYFPRVQRPMTSGDVAQ